MIWLLVGQVSENRFKRIVFMFKELELWSGKLFFKTPHAGVEGGRDHQWKALFTQLSDVPRDMNVAAVFEVVVDAPSGSDPGGCSHVDDDVIADSS